MRNHEATSFRFSIPPWPCRRQKEFFRLFADRDVQRQDGASDPTDDAEKKNENEGDEDTKRHRVASRFV
jgi:hypothetical protein